MAQVHGIAPAPGWTTAYYWSPPTWAKKAGCTLEPVALGTDYGEAKRTCDEVLNLQLDAWRQRDELPSPASRAVPGTFDWMVAIYKSSPKYQSREPRTRKSYDAVLQLVADHRLKDSRRFGSLS